ncbi:MAG TPA: hypothetical protein VHF45_03190 [Thermoleophilaceae bacterium]|nr:hypothetical protein [Thermoleophilaceae bacterium]
MTRRVRRFVPSPAMVVALTAVVLSLGGSAYALVVTGKTIRNNTVTGADIRQRSLTGNDVKRDKIGGGSVKESTLAPVPSALLAHGGARFAVVNGGGQVVRGRDVSSAARTGAGRYQVIFNADVRGCGYYATIGDPSAAGPPQNARVSVASLASNVNGVAIRTENNNGAEVDRGFHLIVFC